jgi:CopG family nickel-responsive transcriptional regulator
MARAAKGKLILFPRFFIPGRDLNLPRRTEGMERVTVSVPGDLLAAFEATMKGLGHKDRSKAVQAAMQHLVSEHRWGRGQGKGVGALLVLYDSRVRGLEDALVETQHRYGDLVTATLHLHLARENCLELIAVKGPAARLRAMTRDLTARRGVKQVKLTVV